MLFAAAILIVIALAGVALQVDDWSRDLSTNRAESSENASDPAMRPVILSVSVQQASELVQEMVGRLPLWQLIEQEEIEQGEGEQKRLVQHYTRTTRLFRFVDDIHVTIRPTPEGSQVSVRSQSRVGKGDLGQNPRNIRELTSGLIASDFHLAAQ